MQATKLVIAATFVALAGVAAMPSVSAGHGDDTAFVNCTLNFATLQPDPRCSDVGEIKDQALECEESIEQDHDFEECVQ